MLQCDLRKVNDINYNHLLMIKFVKNLELLWTQWKMYKRYILFGKKELGSRLVWMYFVWWKNITIKYLYGKV